MSTMRSYLQSFQDRPLNERPALVVQGGGLRAVYSLGCLVSLAKAGLSSSFSMAVGSSAGAVNAGYFLVGESHRGYSLYLDDLTRREFVSPLRFWRIIAIDFLIDCLQVKYPTDMSDLYDRSLAPLYIVLTDATTGEPVLVSSHDDGFELFESYRATVAIPALNDQKVRVGDRYFVDGGIRLPVPLPPALDLGARSAVVIATRPIGDRRRSQGQVRRRLMQIAAIRQHRAVRQHIGVGDETYNEMMAAIERDSAFMGRPVSVVRPSDGSRLIGRTSVKRSSLEDCIAMAESDTERFLASPRPRLS